jgi:hypothetical protein
MGSKYGYIIMVQGLQCVSSKGLSGFKRQFNQLRGTDYYLNLTWDQCYDFKNIYGRNIGEEIAIFDQKHF